MIHSINKVMVQHFDSKNRWTYTETITLKKDVLVADEKNAVCVVQTFLKIHSSATKYFAQFILGGRKYGFLVA